MKVARKIVHLFFVFCMHLLLLTGCGCEHKYNLIAETETCTTAGKHIFECSICGHRYETEAEAGHKWQYKETTSTCTYAGHNIFECSRCQKTKEEPAAALGHEYDFTGRCKRCKKFQYDIRLTQTLPFVVSNYNSGKVLTRSKITEITFCFSDDDSFFVSFKGVKTYDSRGDDGKQDINFRCNIVDNESKSLCSGVVSIGSLYVKPRVGEEFDVIWSKGVLGLPLAYKSTFHKLTAPFYLTLSDF